MKNKIFTRIHDALVSRKAMEVSSQVFACALAYVVVRVIEVKYCHE